MPVSSPLLNNAFGKENRMTTAEDLANRFVKVSQEILTGSRNELYFDMHYVYHCLFRHIFKPVRRSKTLWMLACDMAVEFLIDDGHFRSTRIAHSQYRPRGGCPHEG